MSARTKSTAAFRARWRAVSAGARLVRSVRRVGAAFEHVAKAARVASASARRYGVAFANVLEAAQALERPQAETQAAKQ